MRIVSLIKTLKELKRFKRSSLENNIKYYTRISKSRPRITNLIRKSILVFNEKRLKDLI